MKCKECGSNLSDCAVVKSLQATIIHNDIEVNEHIEIVAENICLHCARLALSPKFGQE